MESESGTTELSFPRSSLYVGNLDLNVTEATLVKKFSEVGTLSSVRVCKDKVTNKSLGYGYVNFQKSQDAETALRTLNFQTLKEKPMRIMWCQRDPSLRKSGVGNIFIKNLDKKISCKDLYDIFSVYGNILSYKIAEDENGDSKGYAFVHFETEKSANNAIENTNGTFIGLEKVYVSKFVSRRDREKVQKSETKSDIKNVMLDDKTLFQDRKKLNNLIDLLQQELQCSVCHDLFKDACMTDCGHIFCNECIVAWKKHNSTCPTCRAILFKPEKKIFEMNNFIVKASELLLGDDKP